MVTVRVSIEGRNRKVGAMVKALAFEVSGPDSVKGASKGMLGATGYLEFNFPDESKADEFRIAVARYLPGVLASVLR